MISDPKRCAAYEPPCDLDPQTGGSVEIFYADRALADSFGTRGGWFGGAANPASKPPTGTFATSDGAYRNFALEHMPLA